MTTLDRRPPVVPVARPLLPTADALLPYLRAVDARRVYSNWGPLNARLEERLSARLGGASVVTASSATSALTCALRAVLEDRPAEARGGLCLMPSWTFVATAHAALAAGLTPCFLDVDEADWALTPEIVRREILAGLGRPGSGAKGGAVVSAVVAVAPFGRPVAPGPWDEFAARTGVPVVLDAAAAFDALEVGRAPAVVSLHATKTVCAGEGGFVATRDADLARRVKRVANFGFFGARQAEVAGANAKLSEYHAAVGLASLDAWPTRRGELARAAARLRAALEPLGLRFADGFGGAWVASSCVARLPRSAAPVGAAEAAIGLGLRGVATRAWWGAGCHTSPAFEGLPRRNSAADGDALPVTARLARETIGLPFACDLSEREVAQVRDALAEVLGTSAQPGAPPPRRRAAAPLRPHAAAAATRQARPAAPQRLAASATMAAV